MKVRAAVRVPEQRPGVDDQRRGRGDRDGVRGDLPRLRVQQEGEAPDARPRLGRRGGVRGRGARLHARPARPGTQAPRRPRHDRLLHLHVRLAPLHHGTFCFSLHALMYVLLHCLTHVSNLVLIRSWTC